ncbi:hypothetical protein BJV82DRAFT_671734 [Fennellomyces sp. T-0311]|nr:hypothetical protein BJV82DRAFT_671734 [Fennellomyces sp. T-0311]
MDVEQTEFWRICDDKGVCHCDWRLTATGCEEESALKIMYIINAVASAFLTVAVIIILFRRSYFQNQTLLDRRSIIPRPKPIETMAIFGIIFHILRMIHAIILVADGVPNVAFRSFFFEFGWPFIFCAVSCYLFGIAHTLASSSKIIYENWVRSPYIIDGAFFAIISLPFISNVVCAIAAGIYALRADITLAAAFTRATYYLWVFHIAILSVLILYAGLRLIRLLRRHFLSKPGTTPEDLEKFHLGALKVKIIIMTAFCCLMVFMVIVILYASFRTEITTYMPYNFALAVVTTFTGVIGTCGIIFAVILDPRIASLSGLTGSSSGSAEATAMSNSRLSKWVNNRSGVTTGATSGVTSGVTSGITTIGSVAPGITSSELAKFRMHPPLEKISIEMDPVPRTSSQLQRVEYSEPESHTQSRVEEDQYQYNAMTSTIRAKPRNAFYADGYSYHA